MCTVLSWTLEHLDRILALIAILDVRKLFKELARRDQNTETRIRQEMLTEAVEVIRKLWRGGMQNHRARYYRVENARIYDLPEQPPSIIISGFGPHATRLAARVGDGFCTTAPVKDAVELFRRRSICQRGSAKPRLS